MFKETTFFYIMVVAGVLQGAVYLKFAISANSRAKAADALKRESAASDQGRIERADDHRERVSPPARFVASAAGFGMAGALLAHLVTPVVAYALMCLSLAGRCVADQIVEERTPRRRSALIGRSRSIDPVLVSWIVLSGATALMLIPWLFEPTYRIAAVVVAACVFVMLAVAWRIATAPPLLFDNDLEAEQVVDHETRILRTGNTCVLTVGTVAIFNAFISDQQGFIDRRFTVWGLLLLWVVLLAWRSIYARRLTGTPLTS